MVNEINTPPSRGELAKARRLLRFAKAELEKVVEADPKLAWSWWLSSLRHVETLRTFMGRTLPEFPDDGTPTFSNEPITDHPSDLYSKRAMEAIKEAFAREFSQEDAPNVTLVCAMPPDGRVAIATTEPDPDDALLALRAGWGAIHRSIRLIGERASRQ